MWADITSLLTIGVWGFFIPNPAIYYLFTSLSTKIMNVDKKCNYYLGEISDMYCFYCQWDEALLNGILNYTFHFTCGGFIMTSRNVEVV